MTAKAIARCHECRVCRHGLLRCRGKHAGLATSGRYRIIEYVDKFDGMFVTTEFVLIEVANFLNRIDKRQLFVELARDLRSSPNTQVIPATSDLFDRGLMLFEMRIDKQWSLTDCTSFVVMAERGITKALASDRHFVQAGFEALLTSDA